MKLLLAFLASILVVAGLSAQLISKSAFWGDAADWKGPEALTAWDASQGRVALRLAHSGLASLDFSSAQSFRLYVPEAGGALPAPQKGTAVALQVTESPAKLTIDTGKLVLTIDKATLAFEVRRGGKLLARQSRPWMNSGGKIAGGFDLPAGDRVYGLGEKASALLKNGQSVKMWNTDAYGWQRNTDPLYLDVPFAMDFTPQGTWGVFFDNPRQSYFSVGRDQKDQLLFGAVGGAFDEWFFAGDTPAEVLGQYTALTGRMRLPPQWALGYHQSRYSYMTQDEVLDIAKTFRQKDMPADVIYLDIDFMDGYRDFTWDHAAFPDPKGMIDKLHALGFKVITIIDPGIKMEDGYAPYDSGLQQNVFVKDDQGNLMTGGVWPGLCVFPDFSKPQTRAWWGRQYKVLTDLGFDGIWNDMNEPSVFNAPGGTLSLEEPHAGVHNLYGRDMARATLEGLDLLRPGQRNFVLSRAGYAGSQQYAAFWTGDNSATWDHLRLNLSMVLEMGLSGFPLVGADVGGYKGNPDSELLARWMQLGAVMPYFRNHTEKGHDGHEPWKFGADAEAVSRTALKLRQTLEPYLYDLAREASINGAAMARPLFWHFPNDAQAVALEDEFLLGEGLLAAPVLTSGAKERQVYLPAGSDWYDWYTGKKYAGGQTLTVPVTLATFPLYARAGAVIPVFSADKPHDLTFRLFPGASLGHQLYLDDGLTNDYQAGKFLLSKVDYAAQGNEWTANWTTVQDGLPDSPRTATGIWPDGRTVTLTRK